MITIKLCYNPVSPNGKPVCFKVVELKVLPRIGETIQLQESYVVKNIIHKENEILIIV